MKLLPLHFLICLLPPLAALSAPERVAQRPKWQERRVALDQRFVAQEEFRIHYTLTVPDTLPAADQVDRDRDGVVDKGEGFLRQFITARRCFVEVLGL